MGGSEKERCNMKYQTPRQTIARDVRMMLPNGKSCLKSLIAVVDISEKDHWIFLKNSSTEILIAYQCADKGDMEELLLKINEELAA